MPIPPAERKELKDCIWASMETKREQYLQIIEQHENSIFSEPIRYHIRNINKDNS